MQKQTKITSNYSTLSPDLKRTLERIIGETLALMIISEKSPIIREIFDFRVHKVTLN